MIAIALLVLLIGAWLLMMAHHFYVKWGNRQREKKRIEFEAEQKNKYLSGVKGSFVPRPGRVMNPLKGYPRNLPCFCESGIKAKKCCLPLLLETCDEKHEERLKNYMKEIKDKCDGQSHHYG